MAVFTYKAIGAGADISGTIAADTPHQARDLLRERGLVVRDISDFVATPGRKAGASIRPIFNFEFRRSFRHHSTNFIREISTLLGVGVPLLEALETIAR